MSDWNIRIRVWPHSTGKGADKDQEACGPKEQSFTVAAQDFAEAARMAKLIVMGIETNPMVWKAPIRWIGETDK